MTLRGFRSSRFLLLFLSGSFSLPFGLALVSDLLTTLNLLSPSLFESAFDDRFLTRIVPPPLKPVYSGF